MSHQRAVIREAIVTALKAAVTPAGNNVFSSRATPLWKVPLPAILVYARQEHSEPLELASAILRRILTVGIEARVQIPSDATLDDSLDTLAKQIEDTVNLDRTFGNQCLNSSLTETEISTSAEGEQPLGAVRLTYEILYTA